MKIFYAVQATGNGHISRAIEVLPHLQKYGEVDIFLSGSNSNINIDGKVQYRSQGVSLFYTGNGGLDYLKTIKAFKPKTIFNQVKNLPVQKYDLVINDFESITALACAYKKVKSINFGHQASFMSKNTPRPTKQSVVGEFVLKNYARATSYVGLHFEQYDTNILPPIIKQAIWNAQPKNEGYITVYLLSFNDKTILKYLQPIKDYRFEVFSKEVQQITIQGNVTLIPVSKEGFNRSLINCHGIITGAGFETPAEALYLQKKILAIPVKGQYEQLCNAAALQKLGVSVAYDLNENFEKLFYKCMGNTKTIYLNYKNNTASIIHSMMNTADKIVASNAAINVAEWAL